MTPLLEVKDLRVEYRAKGFHARANEVLHGVSIEIAPGETLGLVGESGSGKTTLGRAVLGLVPQSSGQITFDGAPVAPGLGKQRRALARDIQVIFQDPYTSLNPAMLVSDILSEPLIAQGRKAKDARTAVRALLDRVALPSDAERRYPREFSGGQRQRIAIARALALQPRLIVCDEPVSALDLSTQARVLDLLIEIQEQSGVAYLFISHDLSVVHHISHRVAVMLRGELVETGSADQVTGHPKHPYTKKLLLSAPVADPDEQANRRAERHRLVEAGM
ncbi:MAG: peptide transporter ATP-binding protein [Rhodoglobus sp.]|nr:peptide transporter ATP-binding protein [Rhodoglobus sp.]